MSPSLDTREHRAAAREIKFVLPSAAAAQALDWARGQLAPDAHGGGAEGDTYRIASIYLDSPSWDVYSGHGSYGRSKYRIRRYADSETVYLERKLRTSRMLAKRRSPIALNELHRLEQPLDRAQPFFWFHRRFVLRRLRPVCQVTYERIARISEGGGSRFRLTFDRDLRAQAVSGLRFQTGFGTPVTAGEVIVEMKFLREPPSVFKYLVEEFALEPVKFSKFRAAVESLGLANDSMRMVACENS